MEKIITLYSTNKEKFEDVTVDCKVVDIKQYVLDELKKQKTQKAKKYFYVKAKPGKVGDKVITKPVIERDGKEYFLNETESAVQVEGSMIVINPMGEEYIVKPEAFAKKYKKVESKEDTYIAVAEAIDYIKLTEDIVFTASWGEEMVGLKGGVLNVSNLNDIYCIQNTCFANTYLKLEKSKEEDLCM